MVDEKADSATACYQLALEQAARKEDQEKERFQTASSAAQFLLWLW